MTNHIQRIKNILLNQCEELSDGECIDEALNYIKAIEDNQQKEIFFTATPTEYNIYQFFYSKSHFVEEYDKGKAGEIDIGYKLFSIKGELQQVFIHDCISIPF